MSNPISYLNVNRETCKTKFIQAISGLTIPSENSATRIVIIFCRIESLIHPLFPYQASNFSEHPLSLRNPLLLITEQHKLTHTNFVDRLNTREFRLRGSVEGQASSWRLDCSLCNCSCKLYNFSLINNNKISS